MSGAGLFVAAALAACGGEQTDTAAVPASPAVAEAGARPALGDAPRRPTVTEPQRRRGLAEAASGDERPGWIVDTQQREAVQLFYRAVFRAAESVPIDWSGSIAGCTAGQTTAALKQAITWRINWVRAMAGVPAAVRLDAGLNAQAQQAALIMAAQGALSHHPPSDWTCWNAEGAAAAGKANLTTGVGVRAIDLYVEDYGANNAAVGHRRWVLYPQTRLMGSGDVLGVDGMRKVSANALWVFDDTAPSARVARDTFVAWPPPGHVPHRAVYPRWSLSYPGADFSQASVQMWQDGVPLAVRLEAVDDGYGENTLVWIPGDYRDGMSWERPGIDRSYRVRVTNVRLQGQVHEANYTVTVFDADAQPPWHAPSARAHGRAAVEVGRSSEFAMAAVNGADLYQWRLVELHAGDHHEGFESALPALQLSTSPGYTPLGAVRVASGQRALQLAHTQAVDQIATLDPVFVPSAAARLRFASRLGWATPAQSALVEISADEGRSWTVVHAQAGTGTAGESAFSLREVDLGAWAGVAVRLRWRYAQPSASYYPQASDGVGWLIDDIALTGVDRFGSAQPPQHSGSAHIALDFPRAGRWFVQAQPGRYGFWDGWGPGQVVTAAVSSVARNECLLDWAQSHYPHLLHPPATTRTLHPYRYRAYADGLYVGVSADDAHVYLLQQGLMSDLGPQQDWWDSAGC